MAWISILCVAVLLMATGAIVGAELQDRKHESQRRRMALRTRQLNRAWQALKAGRDQAGACGLSGSTYWIMTGCCAYIVLTDPHEDS